LLGAVLAILMMAGGTAFAQQGGSQGGGTPAGSPTGSPAGGGSAGDGGSQASDTTAPQAGGETGPAGMEPGDRAGSPGFSGREAGAAFGAWLSNAKEAARLAGVAARLKLIAGPALEAGVPVEAFIARIREAAAKGVQADVLVQAIEEDASGWTWLAGVLRGSSWPPQTASTGFYVSAAIALRNGLDRVAVQEVVEWASGSRASAEKTGAAMTTAAALASRLRDPAVGGEIARVLSRSRLKVGQFPEVAELVSKAAASGVGHGRIMAALGSTIGRGSTLAALEKALAD
jgi:hypothetical protein